MEMGPYLNENFAKTFAGNFWFCSEMECPKV